MKNQAEIIVCADNFHGRTITIVGFSTDEGARRGFGPFTPGFKVVPFGDADELAAAITPNTVAFLVEPIQGEAGVIVPPAGYLKQVRKICDEAEIILILDEIQTGLGRTGKLLAEEKMFANAALQGDYLLAGLKSFTSKRIKEVRGKGLMIGVELTSEAGQARRYCEQLMKLGILMKDTHGHTLRITPPLIITREEVDWMLDRIETVLG